MTLITVTPHDYDGMVVKTVCCEQPILTTCLTCDFIKLYCVILYIYDDQYDDYSNTGYLADCEF